MSISGSGTSADRERLLAAERKRWQYLKVLYERDQDSSAGRIYSPNAFELANAIGITDRDEADRVFTYLKDAGLIKFMTFGPTVAITAAGRRAVERALHAPEEPTQYFGPLNMLHSSGEGSHVGEPKNSVVVLDTNALLALLPQIRDALGKLSGDSARIAAAHLKTLEAHSESPAPAIPIVRESLSSLRSILQHSGQTSAVKVVDSCLGAHGLQ